MSACAERSRDKWKKERSRILIKFLECGEKNFQFLPTAALIPQQEVLNTIHVTYRKREPGARQQEFEKFAFR